MILTYELVNEETEESFGEFDYEVSDDELQDAMLEILYDEYFSDMKEYKTLVKAHIMEMFDGLDIDLRDIAEDYKDELQEYFEEDAWNEYGYM